MEPALVQSLFSRISPGGKEPQEILKTITLGPNNEPRGRTAKLAGYPTSANGNVRRENNAYLPQVLKERFIVPYLRWCDQRINILNYIFN